MSNTPVAKPSWFAAQGIPACSKWGKYEIECCAWMYVQALVLLGDEWGPVLTVAQVRETLESAGFKPDGLFASLLERTEDSRYWQEVRCLTSAEEAFDVGGLSWNRRRFQAATNATQPNDE